MAKFFAPPLVLNPPDIFLPDLHHAQISFGQIVGERHIMIMPEAQHFFFATRQTAQKIVALAAA